MLYKLINQPDATISQVHYLSFKYSSTCFGCTHTHHQELNNCSSSLWFYRWSVVIAVLLVVVGPVIKRLERGGSSDVGHGQAGCITVEAWYKQ
jgi:hypothetical protein